MNLGIRDINAISRSGCTTVEELRQKISDDPDGMKRQLGFATFDRIEEELLAVAQGDMQEPAVVVSTDYTRAVTLTRSIIANAEAAQQSLYEVCKGLKEMRDGKLYKELGYQSFAEYCESETGIKISQAKKYVAIADHMDEKTASQLAKISTEKLYMLSMLDEPTRETVLESVDVENDTVRELRNEINRITSENADLGQKLDAAQETIANKDRQFRAAMDSKNRELECVNTQKKHSDDSYRKTHAEWIRAQNENAALTGKISDLEEQIKELENRPVEVAVSVEEAKEIERLKTELNAAEQEMARAKKEVYAEAQRIADEVRHNMQGVHESEMQALRDGYERQLAEESKRQDRSALDRAKFYALKNVFDNIVDELESFLDELHDEPRIRYINELDNYWTDNLLYLKREGEGAGA